MSGDAKSAKDRLKEFEALLNEYTQKIGTYGIVYPQDVTIILQLTKDHLRGMSPEDLGEDAFILSQYGLYLQKEKNRHSIRVDWANGELDLLIAREAGNYGMDGGKSFIKYELLRSRIVIADSAAQALYQIVKHARARVTEIDQMSYQMNIMSKALIELQQTKRYKR